MILPVLNLLHLDFQRLAVGESKAIEGYAELSAFRHQRIDEFDVHGPVRLDHGPAKLVYASANHANSQGILVSDGLDQQLIEWNVFGDWLREKECLTDEAFIFGACCYFANVQNAITMFAHCPSLKWIAGPEGLAEANKLVPAAQLCFGTFAPGGPHLSLLEEPLSAAAGTKILVWDREVLGRYVLEYARGRRFLRFDDMQTLLKSRVRKRIKTIHDN